MTGTLARLGLWLAVTLAAAAVAPAPRPLDPSLHPAGEALAVGLVAGSALFLVLSRRRMAAAALATVPRRRLLARTVVLTVKSAQEEAIWRGLALGFLVGPLGRLGGLAVSTALFAAMHLRAQGRAAVVHLATGSVFGLAYLATGRLHAAIVAHGGYNVLVGAAALARDELSVSDTGAAPARLVASPRVNGRRTSIRLEGSMPPAAPTVAARLDGVVKSFGTTRALSGVDLELRSGDVLALLGANGAGKSTAVALMLGLRRPDAGSASLRGGDPRDPSSRTRVGAVLQEVGFPPTLRVREVVDLVRAHFPDASPPDEALSRVGLTALADRQAGGLSGGQARRLAVALALAARPEVLFLDEPTAGMDANARRALLRDIAAFAVEGGAVLLTTQQLAEAEEIATRVVVLASGRVVLEGSVPEIRARAGMTRVTVRARRLPPLPGVASVDSRLDRHVVYVADADAFVAGLVRSGVPFSGLEVSPASLEDAFVELTREERA